MGVRKRSSGISMNELDGKKESIENVCVCGGGHQGLSMAAHLALNDVNVRLWNRTYKNIEDVAKSGEIICDGVVNGIAKIDKASSNIEDVICEFIMVTTPSNAHRDIAKVLAPHITKDTFIVLNPGRTFGAIEFAKCLRENGIKDLPHIAETQTIVYTCRRKNENATTIFAIKDNVRIASLKGTDIEYILGKMPKCLKDYFLPVNSVLETSLSNVGMVLHCAPMLMNIGWIESEKTDFKYYYDGISRTIANFIERIDEERIEVAKSLGFNIESTCEWMRHTYYTQGENLYENIRSNKAYEKIDAPESLESRYIYEDIPNGLVPIEILGKEMGIETPNITLIINLANSVMEKDFRKIGREFSIQTIKEYVNT